MSDTFLHYYLHEKDQPYEYKVKIACDEFTDAQIDRLEMAFSKYDLVETSGLSTSPLQQNPLDFPNAKNTRVHALTVQLGYPATADHLRMLIAEHTGINIGCVAVYNMGDPREQYTEQLNSAADQTEYEPVLGADYPDSDHSQLYGEQLTTEVARLAQDRVKQRKIHRVTNNLIPDQVHDDAGAAEQDPGEAGGFSPLGGTQL